jgi:selenocysteine lyase/cysteine desulfurase
VWLDTPGSPPAAAPVTEALRAAVTAWSEGTFQWTDWDGEPARTRAQFAALVGARPEQVALAGSVAEAAATVAAALPPGRIVVAGEEFRSNLLPWLALADRGPHHEVTVVPAVPGRTRSESLAAALDRPAVLVAVSEVLSFDGVRADLPALRRAADGAGARLFVDATQSLGALAAPPPEARPDYLAVHGYKWLLAPRGAAWLAVRPDRVGELRPLLPGWKSAADGYFGPVDYASGAAALDTSTAWLPWIGARAALRLLATLDPAAVEAHCLRLAARFTAEAADAGFPPAANGPASHIAAVRVPDGGAAAAALRAAGIRAGVLGDRLRAGFHYFNDDEDVDRLLAALRPLRPPHRKAAHP